MTGAERMPSCLDLGTLHGPLLLFGGPYSNLQATEALMAEAARRAIPPERMICTGDAVAYGADPASTVDLLRRHRVPTVMGNCEESLAHDAEDCGCGFAEDSACDRLALRWYSYARQALSLNARAWMAGLPRSIRFRLAGRGFLVVHGSVTTINRFLFASDAAQGKAQELAAAGTDAVIAGHCGIAFTQALGERVWHNAGAIGLPANDGTPRTWFSLLEEAADGLRIRLQPLDYDHGEAAGRMRRAGLPEGYAQALESGLWPSEEVLPARERAARGKTLAATAFFWPSRSLSRSRGQD